MRDARLRLDGSFDNWLESVRAVREYEQWMSISEI